MRAGGDIVPHLQLARAGWPAETDPDLLWLKPHLARLRSKVEAAGGPQVVAVRGVGYRIVVERRAPGLIGRVDAVTGARGQTGTAIGRPVDVVGGVGAIDPAAARVTPAERVEVEEGVARRRRGGSHRRRT